MVFIFAHFNSAVDTYENNSCDCVDRDTWKTVLVAHFSWIVWHKIKKLKNGFRILGG